jgi:broad specificity phosphatase PhoE
VLGEHEGALAQFDRGLAGDNRMLGSVTLVRHGETAWSASGQHTGRTDIPLTEVGERKARALRERLSSASFDRAFASPLKRAMRTCELAGFGELAKADPDLLEWDYGDYEGRKTSEILAERAGWRLFRDGCPHGEQPADVGARADRVIARLREKDDRAIVFSSGHILRVLAARWLGLAPSEGRLIKLDTASVSILGYEHDKSEPVIALWNQV